MRRALTLLSTMALVVLLAAGVALAEIRVGTNNPETLTGTNSVDHLTGMGGNDTLVGKAANDTYHFDDGWGQDTLKETKVVKVGKKKLPGGIDTLKFTQGSSNTNLGIYLIPQWAAQGFNAVYGGNGDKVDLGTSPVENAVGGMSNDFLRGGSAKNTLSGGFGGSDDLTDYGGDDGSGVGIPSLPDLPASSDTYTGFTLGTGQDKVIDYGGTADRLDLRPLDSSEVNFSSEDLDGNGSNESLKIVLNDTTNNYVEVYGYYSPWNGSVNGRMEQIIFSDQILTGVF
jgi:Ca2+-binding RTX toxin-like protein